MRLERRYPKGWEDIDDFGLQGYTKALIKTTMDFFIVVYLENEEPYIMVNRDADGYFVQQIFLENVKEFYLIIEE